MVIHLRAIAILILKLSLSRFCGVRLCGFGTLRLLRSVRSEALHQDETPLQSSLLSELNVDGSMLSSGNLLSIFVPIHFCSLSFAILYCFRCDLLMELGAGNVDAVTSTSTRTPILREMEEIKLAYLLWLQIILLNQISESLQKDIDRYEIVPIQDPLSFEKGFFIVIRACQLLAQKNDGLILVGLAGPSGAGKTVY
ncbi:hypothetical protein ACSBR2_042330 [Camellia fascicularis]